VFCIVYRKKVVTGNWCLGKQAFQYFKYRTPCCSVPGIPWTGTLQTSIDISTHSITLQHEKNICSTKFKSSLAQDYATMSRDTNSTSFNVNPEIFTSGLMLNSKTQVCKKIFFPVESVLQNTDLDFPTGLPRTVKAVRKQMHLLFPG